MTKLEEFRIQQMVRLGCCACAYLHIPFVDVEVHHILSGGRRMGDWFTIPLCPGHHRGLWTPEQRLLLTVKQRVSISSGRKAFTRIYPTERELWELTQGRLRLIWPPIQRVQRIA